MFLTINHWGVPVPAEVWTGLSLMGNGWGIFGVTAPLLVFAPRLMWAWLCAAPFAALFARTGKFFIESPRPAAVVDNSQMRVVGDLLHNVSMPSGHTLTAFAVAAAIFFALTPLQRRRHWWLWLAASGTGLSRIMVGAHWPGDVAVGVSFGLLSGLLGHQLWQRIGVRHYEPTAWSLRAVACLHVLAMYSLLTEIMDFDENLPAQYGLAILTLSCLVLFAYQNAKAIWQAKWRRSPGK